MTQLSSNWRDLCLTEVRKWFDEAGTGFESMLPMLYSMDTSDRETEYDHSYSGMGNMKLFTGAAVAEDTMSEEYKTTYTFPEFMNWISIRRKLWDDRRNRDVMNMAKGLRLSEKRTKEAHGAEIFNNAFTATGSYSGGGLSAGSDGKALCANDHPSNADASYAGDNLTTGALSPTTLGAARDLLRAFTDGRGNKMYADGDTILIPANTSIEETAFEIVKSSGKVNIADNNRNFYEGRYKVAVWKELTDSDAWFMLDSSLMKLSLYWIDRVSLETYDDFDETLQILKFIAYCRYGMNFNGWRWLVGSAGA